MLRRARSVVVLQALPLEPLLPVDKRFVFNFHFFNGHRRFVMERKLIVHRVFLLRSPLPKPAPGSPFVLPKSMNESVFCEPSTSLISYEAREEANC